jgi:two-component system, cell cycle response regulator DivK
MGQRQRLYRHAAAERISEIMNARILLIEDNEMNRYLATFLLQAHGFSVTHAATGPAGLESALQERFDCILLDLQLPGMDGYAVAEAIRTRPERTEIPIIAVTSFAMVGDREKALAAGCTGYIEKPINPETFVAEIRHYLPTNGRAEP